MTSTMQEQNVGAFDTAQAVPANDTDDGYLGSSSKVTNLAIPSEDIKDWWRLELGALLLSALTIVGMALFLWVYDGKPAPRWSYNYKDALTDLAPVVKAKQVTINSILSLFSTASRILLGLPLAKALGQLMWVHYLGKKDRKLADVAIFDKAMRKNHRGAMELVWMLKARHFAVVGAVVIFGLTALDYFIQLLVHQPIRYWADDLHQVLPNSPAALEFGRKVQAYQNDPNNAPFPKFQGDLQVARISNITTYAPLDVGEPLLSVDPGFEMKANIWAGLFSTDSLGGWGIPDYYCATGNCTWEGYSTLGVCSRCADITTKLNKTCNAHAADLNNATGCDVVLPNGFSLGGPDGQRNHLLAASADYEPMIYGNYSASLAVIHTIRADDLSTLFVNQSTSLSAYECVMIPCVINYDQSLVLSSDEFKKFGLNFIPFGETAGSIYDNFTLVNSASLGNAPTIQIPFNSSRGNPTTYQMSGPAYIGLQSYLQSMFNGFVTSNGNTSSFEGDNKTRAIKINAADVMQSLNIPTAYCYDIFNTLLADSVTCTMQTTAMAMTKIIRDFEFRTYNFSQYAMTGTTWSPKPMIDVAWLWIIPITALWSLCAILAFGTMWKARRVGAGGMVLDPLTLLFANVEGRNDPEGAAGPWWHSKEEAQKLAEQMQVRLTMDERKVSFVQRSVKVEE